MTSNHRQLSTRHNMAICQYMCGHISKKTAKLALATISIVASLLSHSAPEQPLQALIVDSAPLGIEGRDGKPQGIAIDLFALISRELGRDIEPLILQREAIFNRVSAEQFDLVLLYERPSYDARHQYLGRMDDISHVQIMLSDTSIEEVTRLGYLVQMAPPPTGTRSAVKAPFAVYQTLNEAYLGLQEGEIEGLILPQSSARVILNEPPFNAGIAVKTHTLSSWPVGLYARKTALTAAEIEAVQSTLEIVREEHMIDSFLERFYRLLSPHNESSDTDRREED